MMKLLALALTVGLAGSLPPTLRGREFDHVPTRTKAVALTLDAGGNAVGAWAVIRALRQRHVTATFFVTGRWAGANPKLARVIGRHFDVANHTVSHAHLPRLSTEAVAREIRNAERTIRRTTGRDPRPFFRFPYGDRDARTIAIANRLGYVSVRWSVDSLGWTAGQTPAGAARRVLDALEPGAIILMHVGEARDGSTVDTQALPAVLDGIERRGYRLVTLNALAPRLAARTP